MENDRKTVTNSLSHTTRPTKSCFTTTERTTLGPTRQKETWPRARRSPALGRKGARGGGQVKLSGGPTIRIRATRPTSCNASPGAYSNRVRSRRPDRGKLDDSKSNTCTVAVGRAPRHLCATYGRRCRSAVVVPNKNRSAATGNADITTLRANVTDPGYADGREGKRQRRGRRGRVVCVVGNGRSTAFLICRSGSTSVMQTGASACRFAVPAAEPSACLPCIRGYGEKNTVYKYRTTENPRRPPCRKPARRRPSGTLPPVRTARSIGARRTARRSVTGGGASCARAGSRTRPSARTRSSVGRTARDPATGFDTRFRHFS